MGVNDSLMHTSHFIFHSYFQCRKNPSLFYNATPLFLSNFTYSKPLTLFPVVYINFLLKLHVQKISGVLPLRSTEDDFSKRQSVMCASVINGMHTIEGVPVMARRTIAFCTQILFLHSWSKKQSYNKHGSNSSSLCN